MGEGEIEPVVWPHHPGPHRTTQFRMHASVGLAAVGASHCKGYRNTATEERRNVTSKAILVRRSATFRCHKSQEMMESRCVPGVFRHAQRKTLTAVNSSQRLT
jgi:hypothetical protein